MAKIPLRVYNHEIEKLIENQRTQEAIAHCKQILKFFPKHIDTYRLLGKAFLESQRYGEASDILQRVLSVVPDDFISQLGMSMVREDEGDLDSAIYHMERAFEVQPSNPAIQDELRRLYGRRDGVQPPKIRLTRGALVRMYGRGELFPQAIAEANATLAEDSQRLDMQVLLGRLYYQSGQKVRATEVCSQLVDKLPYCYEANRILADILPETSRPEEAQVYLDRLRALDPYLAFVSSVQPTSADVPDNAVMIDHLDYDPEQDEPAQPGWTQQVGVAWDAAPSVEETPDWMSGEQPEQRAAQVPGMDAEDTPAQPADIPDWMAAAGWQPASGEAEETHLSLDEEPEASLGSSDEVVAAGDLPDWLQSLAPETLAESQEDADETEEDTQWLDQILGPGAARETSSIESAPEATVELPSSDEPAQVAGEVPEWLKDMSATSVQEAPDAKMKPTLPEWMAEGESTQPEASVETPETEIPDWLKAEDGLAESAQPAADTPDWLTGAPDQQIGEQAGQESALPDWLQTQATGDESEQPAPAVPEWLDATSEPVASGMMHEVEAEKLPDWLQDIAQAPAIEEAAGPAVAEEPAAPVSQEPPVMAVEETPLAAEGTPLAPPDDLDAALAWLESLAAKQGADEATLITQPEHRNAEMPEWLQKEASAGEQPAADSEPAGELSALLNADAVEELPATEGPLSELLQEQPEPVNETPQGESESTTGAIEAEIPGWLQEQPQASGEATEAEVTQWLQDQPQHVEEDVTPAVEAEVPEWLQEQPKDVETTEENEVPEWMRGQPEAELHTQAPVADWRHAELEEEAETAEAAVHGEDTILPEWLQERPAPTTQETGAAVPEWLQELSHESEGASPATEEPASETPEWLDIPAQQTAAEAGDLPDWLHETGELAAETRAEEQELFASPEAEPNLGAEEAPAAEQAVAETQTGVPAMGDDIDAALAWLESLAAKQGADEETLITRPEDRADVAPEWVQQAEAEAAVLKPVDLEEEPQPELEENSAGESIAPQVEASAWDVEEAATTAELEIEPLPETTLEENLAVTQEEVSAESEPAVAATEETGWMADEPAPEEKTQPVRVAPVEETAPVVEADTEAMNEEEEALPDWLRDLSSYSVEGTGVTDETATEWMPEASTSPEAAVEMPAEIEIEPQAEPVMEMPASVEVEPEQLAAEDILTPAKETEIEQAPVMEAGAHSAAADLPEALQQAQTELQKGAVEAALARYDGFIQNGELIEETIHDLRDALYRYPMDTSIWQSLGDAYMRGNRIQEALDAYTKAEELLR